MKNELSRAFHNRLMAVALLIGAAITVSHVLFHVLPLSKYIMSGSYPLTVFQHWLGGESSSAQPAMYYMIVPLISAMPYLSTLYEDRKTGYVKNIFTRTSRSGYYVSKYTVTFLSAGTVAILPLILNFLLCAMILPATVPQASTGLYPIYSTSIMGELFYTEPYAYLGVYLALNFVFFGLLATVGLTVSFAVDNVFVVSLSPFMLYLIVFGVTQLTGMHSYCPYGFLRPSQPVVTTWEAIGLEIIALMAVGVTYFGISKKIETY